MAADPVFAATPRCASVTTNGTADTSLTAPSNTATILTAGASGSKVDQLRFIQIITTTAAGILNIFIHDGSAYNVFDQYVYGTGTVSTTSAPIPIDIVYNNLVLPTGYSLRVTNTVASGTGATAATHKVTALGGDF